MASAAEVGLAICRGEWVVLRALAELGADGVVMDVVAVSFEILWVADAAIGEASLPDWKL